MQPARTGELRVSKTLITPQKYTLASIDGASYTAYIDQKEEDTLTIRELQDRLFKKIGDGAIHFVETSKHKEVDLERTVKYYKDAVPLIFTLQQAIRVEPDKFFHRDPFTIELPPYVTGERLFGTIWSLTKVLPGDFYLMLVRDKEVKPLSRSRARVDLSPKAVNGAKIVMKPLQRDAVSVKVKLNTKQDPLVFQVGIKTTFYELKEMIDDRENIPSDTLRLTYNSEAVDDNKILTETGVSNGSLIECIRPQ